MNNVGYRDHTGVFFYQNFILKIPDVYRFLVGSYMYNKITLPQYSGNHIYDTRTRNSAVYTFQRLTLTQHSIQFMGPKTLITIPLSIRNSASLHLFKNMLMLYLDSHTLMTLTSENLI